MDQDMPLGKEVGLGPGYIVLNGDPVGTQPTTAAPPHFRPMSIVAKRSPISATAQLLFNLWRHSLSTATVAFDDMTLSDVRRHYFQFCGNLK